MSRLNLICNGMMLFNEVDADHVDIYIPTLDTPPHKRAYCLDPSPAKSNVVTLKVGAYELTGPKSSGRALADLFDADGCIVLSNNVVDFDDTTAAASSAVITVPKPDLIRLFRACEPNTSVLGSSPSGAQEPTLMHDIAVLSYRNIPQDAILKLFSEVAASSASVFNWILYSNEVNGPSRVSHSGLNDFLTIAGKNTDFVLSNFGDQDASFQTAMGVGMDPIHMQMYHELPATPAVRPNLTSGPAGCSFIVVADQL